jgi:glucan phosphoethanolaminetransferase (alkaline phosphatase superfamily)
VTIPESLDTPLAATDLTQRQRGILRRAAFFALAMAILGPLATNFASGQSSGPADNLDGHAYLSYDLPHRAAEAQSVLFILTVLAMAGFIVALGVVYADRSGRPAFPAVVMIGSAVAFLSLQFLGSASGLTIALLGRGYSSFGTNPSAPLVATMLWDLTNVFVTFGYLPFVVAMFAIATANRSDPILPRWLAGPVTVLAAGFVGIALITTLFIDNGNFTPMSTYAGAVSVAPISLWLAAVAFAVLWRTRSARPHGRRPGSSEQLPLTSGS